MADLLAAALEYAAAGVYVFPARVTVVDGRKQVQPVARWRESSSTTAGTLRDWFAPGQPWAGASLCLDCGRSGIVVVDLDVTGGHDGITAWGALMAEHDITPTPVRSHTPSGGEHWFYREHPRRVVGIDATGKVAPGVDVRGLGGFVIAWPSEDARGAYGAITPAELAGVPLVPDLVIERMTATAPTKPESTTTPDNAPSADLWASLTPPRRFTLTQAREFCRPPLEAFRALRTPEDSGFNAKLNELACTWSHFVPGFMTAEVAERELYEAAEANRSVEWQGEAAVRATIRSGLGQRRDPWKAERVDDDELKPEPERKVRRGVFTGIRERKRTEPRYVKRTDGKALLYPGKDSYLYAETESGKSWLVAHVIGQCIDEGVPVMVVDFEEGDELEYGNRLLDLGGDEGKLSDPARFRYLMVDGKCTDEIMSEADDMGALVVVYEGMSVAYDVYGLQVKENDSATAFRRTLVKPHLVAGRAVLTTDHVVKDRDGRGRYAIGGVMKLNAASGGAFLLVNVEGLAPGQRGASNLYVTKDRPGAVKRHSVPAGKSFDAQVKRVGTLVVDDSRSFVSYLDVKIVPPAADESGALVITLSDLVLGAVDRIKAAGHEPNIRKIRAEMAGTRASDVDAELDRLVVRDVLVESDGKHGARVFNRVPKINDEQ